MGSSIKNYAKILTFAAIDFIRNENDDKRTTRRLQESFTPRYYHSGMGSRIPFEQVYCAERRFHDQQFAGGGRFRKF